MNNQNNDFFTNLVDKAMQIPGRTKMRPVIEKELLHYDILFCLDKAELLKKLTFQGGTSLRLIYGGLRFSEDLDFVGGVDFEYYHLQDIKSCIEKYLSERYKLEVYVKEPKEIEVTTDRNIQISKWQIHIVTYPERKDIPKQMIKVEIANVPAHTRELRPLQHNYDFLPDGYSDILIMVESLNEILSDKLIAFVNCYPRIRNRDIWDFYWLHQKGTTLDMHLVKQKIKDYKIDEKSFRSKIDQLQENLKDLMNPKSKLQSDFTNEMQRFLPDTTQEATLNRDGFFGLLFNMIYELLQDMSDKLFCDIFKQNDEDIYFRVSDELTAKNFERAWILASKSNKYIETNEIGFPSRITYGKSSELLLVAERDEKFAQKIKDQYIKELPKGYVIDSTLIPGEWLLKFSPAGN